ncbi:MAG: hypothetical protein JWR63_1879 [Conexibacter sp.]|nr:hypothetical protein [Conexibacter sp.]
MNGELDPWSDFESAAHWQALLLGNGLSINVWKGFAYGSLFEEAKKHSGPLDTADLKVFEKFDTENFEVVLHSLRTAMLAAEAVGQPADAYLERYRSIQVALGHAVGRVHLELSEVPNAARKVIQDLLCEQRVVFTTSYDLLLYWSMGCGDDYRDLVDCFWFGAFNPHNAAPFPGRIPVYFLHGAMHLAVVGDGTTHKIARNSNENVLDQFGQPIGGDPRTRPLLITEGSSHDKLRAIEDNDYLRYVLRQFQECDLPLVVFGSALSPDQDAHLVEAINRHPDRPVAVSLRPGRKSAVRKRQAEVRAALETDDLYFFDSTTHPLGAINWSAEVEKWRDFTGFADL